MPGFSLMHMKGLFIGFVVCLPFLSKAEDGYRLWLRYDLVKNTSLLQEYRTRIAGIQVAGNSASMLAAKEELHTGLEGLLGKKINDQTTLTNGSIIAGTPAASAIIPSFEL